MSITISRKIVLIDQITESIYKTYESKKEASADLGITERNIHRCVTHELDSCSRCYIIKYEDEATQANIKLWCSKIVNGRNGERKCSNCKIWIVNIKDGHCYCDTCDEKRRKEYRSTESGYFKCMAIRMKLSAASREEKGRNSAGVCEIDHTFLIKLFHEQKGLCYYSGLPMVTVQNSNWQASPERLDNDIGYSESNTKLICLEFNTGHFQWNRNKIMQIRDLSNKIIDLDALEQKVSDAKQVKRKNGGKMMKLRKEEIIINGETLFFCTKCKKYLNLSHFMLVKKQPYIHCRDCVGIKCSEYRNSMRGFLVTRLNAAKQHCDKVAKNKKKVRENLTFELTLDILLQKILDQKGRCYYSGIELSYKPDTPWMLSLERLDSKKGYTVTNTVLVCVEFNTIDKSPTGKNVDGSGQWSRDKFNYLIKNMQF